MWHRRCAKVYRYKTATEDAVSGILLVAKGKTNLVAVVNLNELKLDSKRLGEDYHSFKSPFQASSL